MTNVTVWTVHYITYKCSLPIHILYEDRTFKEFWLRHISHALIHYKTLKYNLISNSCFSTSNLKITETPTLICIVKKKILIEDGTKVSLKCYAWVHNLQYPKNFSSHVWWTNKSLFNPCNPINYIALKWFNNLFVKYSNNSKLDMGMLAIELISVSNYTWMQFHTWQFSIWFIQLRVYNV